MISLTAGFRLRSVLWIGLSLPPAGGLADSIPVLEGAVAEQVDVIQLAALARSPKLLDAPAILADLREGASETAIIVTLRSTPTAQSLTLQSQRSASMPEAFERAGAPDFYDLQNQDIRTRLRQSVGEEVSQVLGTLVIPGMRVTQRFSYQFGFAARVTAEALARLAKHPDVIRIEQDGLLEPQLSQGLALMGAELPRASYDGSGVSIAICDTGIDTTHPQLGGGGLPIFNAKVIGGYDTGDDDADPRPGNAGEPHGTACAGIAAGNLGAVDDYIGGVAPGAKLYALKISYGTSGSASYSAMIAAWEWAISHQNDDPANPIRVISTSFGGGNYSGRSGCDRAVPAMTTAAANAVAAGISLFASSGNGGECDGMAWPACISYVNSVGAVYDADLGSRGYCVAASCATGQPAFGCSSGWAVVADALADRVSAYSNSASFLTLFAPSNNASTTDILGKGGYSSGDYTSTFGGTSAACAYAAGAAAVLQSAASAKTGAFLSPAEVSQLLIDTGDPVTDDKIALTKPRINLAQAVAALPGDPRPSLSGRVTRMDDGEGLGDVTLTCDNGGGVATTGRTGDYRIATRMAWSGACAPSRSVGGFFTPPSRHYGPVTDVRTGQDYSWGCTSTTTTIAPGSLLNGLLANTHCYSTLSSSRRFYDVFSFAAIAGITYSIDLTSPAFDAYLYLLGAGDEVLSEDNDGGGAGNARIRYRPQTSGELRIFAMSVLPDRTGAYAVALTAETPAGIPAAPSMLSATGASSSQINLSWRDNSANESGFQIQRKSRLGQWAQIDSVAADMTGFLDHGLSANTRYAYRVRAYGAAGGSAYSNLVWARTAALAVKPAAPTMLRATAVSGSQVKLSWRDNSTSETGFQVERRLRSEPWVQIGDVASNVTGFVDTALRARTRYAYRVRAYNASKTSGYSNQVAVTTR